MKKRVETIKVAGKEPITLSIYRTVHGPVISPNPFDPKDPKVNQVYTWKSAHWMIEPRSTDGWLKMMRASNVKEFEEGLGLINTSLHTPYIDRPGNIGYWMTGLVPVRPAGYDFRLPLPGTGEAEWRGGYVSNPKALNPKKGYVAGWNDKSAPEVRNPDSWLYGPFGKFHRGIWIHKLIEATPSISMDDMKRIAESIGGTGVARAYPQGFGFVNAYLLPHFYQAVGSPRPGEPLSRLQEAMGLLSTWDGRDVKETVSDTTLLHAKTLFDTWLAFMVKNTFEDEFKGIFPMVPITAQHVNMLLHALEGPLSALPPSRNYFDDITTPDRVETASDMIVKSLNQALDKLSADFKTTNMGQWLAPRPRIDFRHALLGVLFSIPYSNRSTYSLIAEAKKEGVEAVGHFPLGQSGFIGLDTDGKPAFDPHFSDLHPIYRDYKYKATFFK